MVTGPGGLAELPDQVRPLPVAGLLATAPVESRPPAEPVEATDPTEPADLTAATDRDRPAIAFVFYTSGTTGRPKGVEVPDAAVLRLARPGYLWLAEARRFGCLSNPAFDAISFEVWVPLLTGGCCVILDEATVAAPDRLAAALLATGVDTMFITAALFNTVVEQLPHCFTGVRQLLVGGDQLNAALIRRWYRDNPDVATRLYNGYGPTETATFALSYAIPRDFDADLVPIGTPLPGTEVVLLHDDDDRGRPGRPATAETAELLIGGEAVAAGYRNLPAETEQRFVRLPELGGGRYYRTGDLVRRADGLVTYLGRTDRQVKVRGFRIEPGELETAADRAPGDQPGLRLHPAHRRDHRAAGLPGAGRPAGLRRVRAAPGGHPAVLHAPAPGVPARRAAADPERQGRPGRAARPGRPAVARRRPEPETETSGWRREVLELAGELLGASGLRPSDSWIASGGDSLKALLLRYEARRRWGSELSAGQVLTSTLGELAEAIAAGRDATRRTRCRPRRRRPDRAPATSEQQRLWLLQQQDPAVGGLQRRAGVPADRLGRAARAAAGAARAGGALSGAAHRLPAGGRRPATGGGRAVRPVVRTGPAGDWRAVAERLLAEPFDLAEPRMLQACWLAEAEAAAADRSDDQPDVSTAGCCCCGCTTSRWTAGRSPCCCRRCRTSYAAALAGTEPSTSRKRPARRWITAPGRRTGSANPATPPSAPGCGTTTPGWSRSRHR